MLVCALLSQVTHPTAFLSPLPANTVHNRSMGLKAQKVCFTTLIANMLYLFALLITNSVHASNHPRSRHLYTSACDSCEHTTHAPFPTKAMARMTGRSDRIAARRTMMQVCAWECIWEGFVGLLIYCFVSSALAFLRALIASLWLGVCVQHIDLPQHIMQMSGTQMLLTLFLLNRLPLLLTFVLTHTYARTHTTYYTLCTVHAHTHMLIRSHTHTSLQVLETTDPDPEIVMGDQVVKMFGNK